MVSAANRKAAKLDFKPLRDLVLVRNHGQNQTPGGIALPEGAEIAPPTGTVVRVGPEVTDLVEGDQIYMMFQSYGPPMTVPFHGVEYLLVHSNEIVGKKEPVGS
jgi:co-chaperonin GroES (HSP10)